MDTLLEIVADLTSGSNRSWRLAYRPCNRAGLDRPLPACDHLTPIARTFRLPNRRPRNATPPHGRVAVITAGTSDLPVAFEAQETLRWMNVGLVTINDVGVAGPHRLPAHLDQLRNLDAAVVVAGMEGALPSVVGGYLELSGDRRTDQRGLRGQFSRRRRPAGDAQ